jgi:epoxyqueuosine reductase QueG
MLSEKFYRVDDPRIGLASTWSERHAAFAAGLGTFSINGGFITASGIAHRIGSVVTDIVFEPSMHPYSDYKENCLTCRGVKCGVCIDRCPAKAITLDDHDKYKCQSYTYSRAFKRIGKEYGVSITGCGLCQTDVPCEFGIPVK